MSASFEVGLRRRPYLSLRAPSTSLCGRPGRSSVVSRWSSVAAMAVRVLMVLLALVAGGWLAVQERAATAEAELETIAFDPGDALAPGAVARADDLLRTDRRLNPDRRPDLYEAVVLGRTGRTREA